MGDFGVPIAIFLMIVVDISIEDAYTQVDPCSSGSFFVEYIYHTHLIRLKY